MIVVPGPKPKLLLRGQQFGDWTVVDPDYGSTPSGHRKSLCRCVCGTEKVQDNSELRSGRTVKCIKCLGRDHRSIAVSAGQIFGHLTVIDGETLKSGRNLVVKCLCSCGRSKLYPIRHLASGHISSCGHTRGRTKHGLQKHELYYTWVGVVRRCHDPRARGYESYGGRGIIVKPEWREDPAAFIGWVEANIGPRPPGKTIDRIDVDGNYEPGNIRWATAKEQANNRRPQLGGEALTGKPDTQMWCPTCGEPMGSLSAFDRHHRREHAA